VLLNPLTFGGLLRLRVEEADNAVGIANGRDLRIGDHDRDIGVTHSESCSTFNARRAIADHPVEFLPQLTDHASNAFVGQRVLISGLRGG
jgi:hypothetical protein